MRRLVVGSLLALAGTAVQAADNGIYLGAGISQSKIDDVGGVNVDVDDTAWKIIAGIRPLDFLAVEASYMDLGEESTNIGGINLNGEAKAFAGYGILFLPLPVPLVDLYGKLGLARWELEGRSSGNLFAIDDNGTEFAYGIGGQVRFGSLAARLEYESFDIDNTDGLDLYSLAVTWTFF